MTLKYDFRSGCWNLKWYCDQKNTLILFFFGFWNLFLRNTPKTKFLPLILRRLFIYTIIYTIFRFNGPPLLHQKGYSDVIYLECSVWTRLINNSKHDGFGSDNGKEVMAVARDN